MRGGAGPGLAARKFVRRRLAAVVLASALAAGFAGGGPIGVSVPGASATQPSAGSVLDGVFTAAQASRGERTFREVCAACHDTGEFSGGRSA